MNDLNFATGLQNVEELSGYTGRTVWCVFHHLHMDGFKFFPSNKSNIIEWKVGPFLHLRKYCGTADSEFKFANRNTWGQPERLFCADWTAVHCLKMFVDVLMISGYFPNTFLLDRFGQSAIFAAQSEARKHAVHIALAYPSLDGPTVRDDWTITTEKMPRHLLSDWTGP